MEKGCCKRVLEKGCCFIYFTCVFIASDHDKIRRDLPVVCEFRYDVLVPFARGASVERANANAAPRRALGTLIILGRAFAKELDDVIAVNHMLNYTSPKNVRSLPTRCFLRSESTWRGFFFFSRTV